MKKFLFTLMIFCLFALNIAAKTPHAVEEDFDYNKIYALDILAQKRPLKYSFQDETGNYQNIDIPSLYQKWFKGVQSYLNREKNPVFDRYKDIVDFAASPQAYELSGTPDIAFFVTVNNYSRYCSRNSAGCFKHNNNIMNIAVRPVLGDAQITLVHEIGHSLRLLDLYDGEFQDKYAKNGSGVQKAIMNEENRLTCDDYDGIINALYLVFKQQNPQEPDLDFTSFCGDKKYHNAQQLDREPVIVDYNNTRTVYTFCKEGGINSIFQSEPNNIGKIHKVIQRSAGCQYIPFKSKLPALDKTNDYTLKDLLTREIVQSNHPAASTKHLDYFLVPDMNGLNIKVNLEDKTVPAVVISADENNKILYLYAYLNKNYVFVFDRFERAAFVYDRQNLYDIFTAGSCQPKTPPDKCAEMKKLRDDMTAYFNIKKEDAGWGGIGFAHKYIENASLWELWLKTNFKNSRPIIDEMKKEISSSDFTTSGFTKINL